VLSLLLHVIFFVVWALLLKYDLMASAAAEQAEAAAPPLVFEFEKSKPKTVVETPDDAEIPQPPEDADYLSDKNARARNPETDERLDVGEAFARGDFRVPELPTQQMPPGQEGQVSQQEQVEQQQEQEQAPDDEPEENAEALYADRSIDFNRDYLVKPQQTRTAGAREQRPHVRRDNRQTRAPDMGGMSFNTYNWDFAPYMLLLKRKVERNIFPPPAFIRLGLISGETMLRFRIYPNGELQNLEILDYTGHRTLMETSFRAIEISAPFPNLPEDFPEPYLEVTAKFSYFIKNP